MEEQEKTEQVKTIAEAITPNAVVDDGGIKVLVGVNNLPENKGELEKIKSDILKKTTPADDTKGVGASSTPYTYMPAWDIMKEDFDALGLEFQMPDPLRTGQIENRPLTQKEEFQLMRDMIIENTTFGFEEDPFMMHYIQAKEKNEGITAEDFIEEYQASTQIQAMDDKEFLASYLRNVAGQSEENPNGLTEEVIQDSLNKLKPAQIKEEATKYKNEVLNQFNERQTEIRKANEQKIEAELKVQDGIQQKMLDTVINNVKTKKGFDNIAFDEQSLQELSNTFKDVFTRNESNPLINVNIPKKFVDMLTQDNLFKIVAYLNKPEMLQKKASEKIKDLEEQLGVKPSSAATQFGSGTLRPV